MEIVTDDLMSVKIESFTHSIKNNYKTEERAYRHLVKADALRINNNFWESIDEYYAALEHAEGNIKAEIFKGLGFSYKQTGFTEDAANAFNKARKITPFDKILYYELGCCYCMDKKYNKAINEYKKALKLSPDYTEAKLNLALAYELCGQNNKAIKTYIQITQACPENVSAYNALGSLYIKLEYYNTSIKTFRCLLRIKRDYARAYLGIAIAYDKMGCRKECIRNYRKYIELKPNCGNLPFILDRLKELKTGNMAKKQAHLRLVV